jgi:hypothetical protein
LRQYLKNYLLGVASNCDPPDHCSWVARITGVSHQHPAFLLFLKYDREEKIKTNKKLSKIKLGFSCLCVSWREGLTWGRSALYLGSLMVGFWILQWGPETNRS